MLGDLVGNGFALTQDPAQADVIIVNTCSFIESAVNESIDAILGLVQYKKSGKCIRLIVTGCLPERFREDAAQSLPEVDVFLGTGAYNQITDAALGKLNSGGCLLPMPDAHPLQESAAGRIISTSALAYLKIAEGCDRHCTYCIIPKLRGRLRSRPIDDIADEARNLIDAGYKEIVVIGQDTYSYGKDLIPQIRFSDLLSKIAQISNDIWIRFLYGSPDMTDDALIHTVAKYDNICSYFDIPIQHASPSILKKMGRPYSYDALLKLFEKIRSIIPDAALRTTLLVGFPGETEKDFKLLTDFMQTIRFDHAGVFMYSDSDDLAAHHLKRHVAKETARQRYEELMTLQAGISFSRNQQRVGQTYPVLIENQAENRLCVGRTCFQAPEVDGVTYVESDNMKTGEFASVRIFDADEYDLKGKVA